MGGSGFFYRAGAHWNSQKDEPSVSLSSERSSLLRLGSSVEAQEKKAKIVNAAFYGVQVFYSFFIMCVPLSL